jgi:tetratricopeptide (TPR) repeat protein
LDEKIKRLLIGMLLGLAACSTAPDKPGAPDSREVDERVREPARQQSDGVLVYPLRNPAVEALVEEAATAEAAGDLDQSAVLLERALRIQPRNPEILQQMAEIQLQKQDYEQALTFATRSYDIGPRVGEICSRNWRTISVAREYLGDANGSAEASEKASVCMNTKPRGL